jgi:hypothetical protein
MPLARVAPAAHAAATLQENPMASKKQTAAARRNIKKAARRKGARR